MDEVIEKGIDNGAGAEPPGPPQTPIFKTPAPGQVNQPGSALARQVFDEARRRQQAEQKRIQGLQLYRDDVRHYSIAKKVLYAVGGAGLGVLLGFGIARIWRSNA